MIRNHFRSVAFLLVLLLLLQITAPAFALTFPGFGGGSGETVYLCSAADDIAKDIIVLEEQEPIDSYLSELPMNGQTWVYFATDGSMQMVPVAWQTDAPFLTAPGLHEMTAQATTSAAIQLADGYDGIITWPVFRKGTDALLELQSLCLPSVRSHLIAEGSDTSCLHETLQLTERVTECKVSDYWMLDTRNDPAFRWVWDTSAVDSSRTGHQTISAALEYPDWVSVPEEYCSVSEAVFIMPADRIELWAPVSVDLNGKMTFRWLYEASSVTGAALQWKKADTAYQSCDDSWYTFTGANSASSGSLLLHLRSLPVNTPLTFQLCYYDTIDGITKQHFTEPVTITVPEHLDELLHKNITAVLDGLTGDRDGGDKGEITLPDYSQPAPVTPPDKNENKNENNSDNNNNHSDKNDDSEHFSDSASTDSSNSASAPVRETVTDTYTEIGGKRLAALISLGDFVLFEKQGVSAEIPSSLLENLALGEQQLLKVTLLHPDSSTVQISVLSDGQHVENLAGTVITMPWELPAGNSNALFCTDYSGRIISPAVYDANSGTVRFAINAPGTWHVTTQPASAAPGTADDTASVTDSTADSETNAAAVSAQTESIRNNSDSHTPADIVENDSENTPETIPAADTAVSAANKSGSVTIAVLIPVLLLTGGVLLAGRWRR